MVSHHAYAHLSCIYTHAQPANKYTGSDGTTYVPVQDAIKQFICPVIDEGQHTLLLGLTRIVRHHVEHYLASISHALCKAARFCPEAHTRDAALSRTRGLSKAVRFSQEEQLHTSAIPFQSLATIRSPALQLQIQVTAGRRDQSGAPAPL